MSTLTEYARDGRVRANSNSSQHEVADYNDTMPIGFERLVVSEDIANQQLIQLCVSLIT
jgi:hypothetical protein